MIAHILLKPHTEHRPALLAPHAPSCRRVVPGAVLSWGTLVGEPGDVRHHVALAGSCPVDEYVHLPLGRDGVVVEPGIDRCSRVVNRLSGSLMDRVHVATLELEVNILLGRVSDTDPAVALRRLGSIVFPIGILVLLDVEGRQVAS